MALVQKTAQLQQTKIDDQLAVMASEQKATQSRQQTSILNDVQMSASLKPDYSNLRCFNYGKMGHSAKIYKQPKPMPTVADRNCFHCHQSGHFRRNCPMIALKSGDGADPRPSTNSCKKIEYTKTREAYIDLVIVGRTRSCLLDTGSDVALFPHAPVRELNLDQCVFHLSAAKGNSIPILSVVTVTVRLRGSDIEIEGLVTDHVDEVLLGLDWLQAKGADWNFRQEN